MASQTLKFVLFSKSLNRALNNSGRLNTNLRTLNYIGRSYRDTKQPLSLLDCQSAGPSRQIHTLSPNSNPNDRFQNQTQGFVKRVNAYQLDLFSQKINGTLNNNVYIRTISKTTENSTNSGQEVKGRTADHDHDHEIELRISESLYNQWWLIRLANENGYMSWCRNTYITSVVGATIYTQDALIPYAKEVGVLVFFIGGLNMAAGTLSFVYNLGKMRRKGLASSFAFLGQSSVALLHICLWSAAMMIYLGYVEDDEDDDDELIKEVERLKQSKSFKDRQKIQEILKDLKKDDK